MSRPRSDSRSARLWLSLDDHLTCCGLAHVELGVDDLDAARGFYVDLLGFVEHRRDYRRCYLRGAEEFDAWSLKLTEGEAGLVHSGFRVSRPDDLDEIEALHRELGLPVERAPAGTEPEQGAALRTGPPRATASSSFTSSARSTRTSTAA